MLPIVHVQPGQGKTCMSRCGRYHDPDDRMPVYCLSFEPLPSRAIGFKPWLIDASEPDEWFEVPMKWALPSEWRLSVGAALVLWPEIEMDNVNLEAPC